MEELSVSFVARQGYAAVVISGGSKILDCYVRRIPSSVKGQFRGILYVFNLALKHLDKVLSGRQANVVFEHSNYTFEKWVNCQYSKLEYQSEFDAAMRKLQRLPLQYKFVHNPKPLAVSFCSDKYVKQGDFV